MKKILSLFQRNYETDRLVRDEVVPGSEWVAAGEGVATRKYDGACCMVRDGKLYRRHEVREGKTPPPSWEPATEVDPVTDRQMGWIPVGDGPNDRWFREGHANTLKTQNAISLLDGTYELVGPAIQLNVKNPEGLQDHILIMHETANQYPDCPRTFEELKAWLSHRGIEGVVWHHPDGRMVKIKAKDFGIKRNFSAVVSVTEEA